MMKTLSFAILVVCVVMMVVEIIVAHGFLPMEENPMIGPDSLTLAELGASYGYRLQQKWEVYRLFSPIFLHGGLIHIFGNMLFLVFLGVPLEQKWGWQQFALVFFLSGIGASLFSVCIHPNTISVGASGALFGLLGASLADILVHWASLDPQIRKMQLVQQIVLIVIWMFVSFGVKFIDGWAHLGGLVAGFMIGCAIWLPEMDSNAMLKAYGRPGFIALGSLTVVLLSGLFFGRVIATEAMFGDY
jgi:membrane associated rhomboid family serine protease